MKKRVLALAEIKKRIKDQRTTLAGGVKSFHTNVQRALREDELPAICLSEGVDEITKRAARNKRGLPCERSVELVVDLVDFTNTGRDIRKSIIDIREVILEDIHPVLEANGTPDFSTSLSELRIEGPFGYGLQDVEGIRLVLGLNYVDNGSY